MEVVEFRYTHHDALKKIWAQYDWEAPSIEVLPKKGCCFCYGKDSWSCVCLSFV